ncbi:MAG: hypothetical protein KF690_10410 [Bacteroidetes bacterium]|nr:hypothetical protein [Bacteroidota bacterium]
MTLVLWGCNSVLDKTYNPATAKADLQELADKGDITELERFVMSIYITQLDKPEEMTYRQILAQYRAYQADQEKASRMSKELLPTALRIRLDKLEDTPDALKLHVILENTTDFSILRYDYGAYVLYQTDTLTTLGFKGNQSFKPGEKRSQQIAFEKTGLMSQMADKFKGRSQDELRISTFGKDLMLGREK